MLGLVLQWTAFFITIITLFSTNRGQSTRVEKTVISYVIMTLVAGAGYLFELSASGAEAIFMARQMQCGAELFMGYFLCLFFYYRIKNRLSGMLAVYGMLYNLALLVAVWTSSRHELVFRGVRYDSGHLVYTGGELGIFITAGSVLVPVILSVVMLVSYLGRENCVQARRQMIGMAVVLFASYGSEQLFFAQAAGDYNFWGAAGMLFADVFIWHFLGQKGFQLESAAAETVLAGMDEGVIVLDAAGRLVSCNAAALCIFPDLAGVQAGHGIRRLQSIPLALFSDYEQLETDIDNHHYIVKQTNIQDAWAQGRGRILVFTDCTKERAYIEEITAVRKKAESAKEEAISAMREARHANRMKSDFLTNLSHEIRTPMNAIVGLSELIIEESRGRKVYDFASDIRTASSNLLVIINDILSLSKIENGQMELSQEEYGTEQLLEETLHLAKLSAASRGLQLRRDISGSIPCRLIGDPVRIRQMITNFLYFSMKHTKRGYLKVTVTSRWLDEERVVLIFQFEDTGCGFAPEELNGIFDQFQSMDGRREQNLESIGLGIALTRRFVDLMEGTVDVTSKVGEGTVFTVSLPQKVADIRTIEQQPWQKNDVRSQLEQAFIVPDYRVLVVDDNRINRKVACGALEPYQFLVDEAKSGAQAIGLVQKNRYDMILMDHMMPEMDGIETTDHIRRECGENGEAPVIIALSANAYNNAREMFMSSGFQDFIAKPVDKDELHCMLCRWIEPQRRQSVAGTPETLEKIARADAAGLYMSGVDTERVLRAHSGGIEDYLELLELYEMDGEPKTELIRRLAAEENYKDYEIEVHGLKSASANIGAYEFSELAKSHELAAKEGNEALIREDVGHLLAEYGCLLDEIRRVLRAHGRLHEQELTEQTEGQMTDEAETHRRMQEILSDVENFRPKDAAAKTEALLSENIEKSARECLKETRNRLKMYEDDAAEDILRAFLGAAAGDASTTTLGDSESWKK